MTIMDISKSIRKRRHPSPITPTTEIPRKKGRLSPSIGTPKRTTLQRIPKTFQTALVSHYTQRKLKQLRPIAIQQLEKYNSIISIVERDFHNNITQLLQDFPPSESQQQEQEIKIQLQLLFSADKRFSLWDYVQVVFDRYWIVNTTFESLDERFRPHFSWDERQFFKLKFHPFVNKKEDTVPRDMSRITRNDGQPLNPDEAESILNWIKLLKTDRSYLNTLQEIIISLDNTTQKENKMYTLDMSEKHRQIMHFLSTFSYIFPRSMRPLVFFKPPAFHPILKKLKLKKQLLEFIRGEDNELILSADALQKLIDYKIFDSKTSVLTPFDMSVIQGPTSLRKAVQNNPYEQTTINDIPIYFVIVAPKIPHASILVLYQHNWYSIGLGHSEELSDVQNTKQFKQFRKIRTGTTQEVMTAIKDDKWWYRNILKRGMFKGAKELYDRKYYLRQLILYSPDDIINFHNPRRFAYKIVDIGIFTKHHLTQIESFFKRINTIEFRLMNKKLLSNGTYVFHRRGMNFDLKTDLIYSHISGRFGPDNEGNYHNCTTFVEKIFPNIQCTSHLILVDPNNCKRRGKPLTTELLERIFVAMQAPSSSPLLELLKQIAPRQSTKAV
jgi:hypothetical protein